MSIIIKKLSKSTLNNKIQYVHSTKNYSLIIQKVWESGGGFFFESEYCG
jgi:hypothetical protein